MKKITFIIIILSLFILGCIPNNTTKSSSTSTFQTTNIPTYTITKIQNTPTLTDTRTITRTKTITSTITLTPTYIYYEYEPKIELGSVGSVLPVTKEEVCDINYPLTVKEIPIDKKEEIFNLYGIAFNVRNRNRYETDYIISSDLGGSNNIDNLWTQSYNGIWNAYDKDKLEVYLHTLVCKGILDLDVAQQKMAKNWVENYIRYFGNPYK